MRLIVVGIVCGGCGGSFESGPEDLDVDGSELDGDGSGGSSERPDDDFEGDGDGDIEPEGSGGLDGSGGASEPSGGTDGSGGLDGSGGALGTGGHVGSGGQGSGGSPGSGGATQETVIWSGSYAGESLALFGDTFLGARLFTDHPDCPISVGEPFVPGDTGTFDLSTTALSCANTDEIPVALFGPMEWDMPLLPEDLSGVDLIRFTLNEFTASPWPATTGTTIWVDFEWEFIGH